MHVRNFLFSLFFHLRSAKKRGLLLIENFILSCFFVILVIGNAIPEIYLTNTFHISHLEYDFDVDDIFLYSKYKLTVYINNYPEDKIRISLTHRGYIFIDIIKNRKWVKFFTSFFYIKKGVNIN